MLIINFVITNCLVLAKYVCCNHDSLETGVVHVQLNTDLGLNVVCYNQKFVTTESVKFVTPEFDCRKAKTVTVRLQGVRNKFFFNYYVNLMFEMTLKLNSTPLAFVDGNFSAINSNTE